MTEQIQEQLSALMDGELERDELRFLLRRLDNEPAAIVSWSRYCVARQVLRRDPVMPVREGFVTVTMARIDAEALPVRGARPWLRWASGGAIAASVAVVALSIGNPFSVDPLAVGPFSAGPGASGTEVADSASNGSVAVAQGSSVAMLERSGRSEPASATSRAYEFRPPMLAPSQPVAASRGGEFVSTSDAAVTGQIEYDPRLRSYLIRHYEASGAAGQSGFVPYALLVAPSSAPQGATEVSPDRPH